MTLLKLILIIVGTAIVMSLLNRYVLEGKLKDVLNYLVIILIVGLVIIYILGIFGVHIPLKL